MNDEAVARATIAAALIQGGKIPGLDGVIESISTTPNTAGDDQLTTNERDGLTRLRRATETIYRALTEKKPEAVRVLDVKWG